MWMLLLISFYMVSASWFQGAYDYFFPPQTTNFRQTAKDLIVSLHAKNNDRDIKRLLDASAYLLLYKEYELEGPRSVSWPTLQLLCRKNIALLDEYHGCSLRRSSPLLYDACHMHTVEGYYFDAAGRVVAGNKEGFLLDDYSRKESISALISDDMNTWSRLQVLASVNKGVAQYWLKKAASILEDVNDGDFDCVELSEYLDADSLMEFCCRHPGCDCSKGISVINGEGMNLVKGLPAYN